MTYDRARRFGEWQDSLTIDILEQSIPAIADDLADWYCRNHTPALDPTSGSVPSIGVKARHPF